jgi:hypothetical protein
MVYQGVKLLKRQQQQQQQVLYPDTYGTFYAVVFIVETPT